MLKFKPGEFAYLYYSQLIVIVGPVCNAVRLSFSAGFASARDLIKSPSLSPSHWQDLSLWTGRNFASWSPGDQSLLGSEHLFGGSRCLETVGLQSPSNASRTPKLPSICRVSPQARSDQDIKGAG